MTTTSDAALAFLLSQHRTTYTSSSTGSQLVEPVARKRTASSVNNRAASELTQRSKGRRARHPFIGRDTKGLLREPTIESSKTFLVAARRRIPGKRASLPSKPFVGFDRGGDFGTQDTRARSLAQTTLRPVSDRPGPTREERGSAAMSARFRGRDTGSTAKHCQSQAQAEKFASVLIEYEKSATWWVSRSRKERLYGKAASTQRCRRSVSHY